ncbi:MAG: hypothetical protein GX493_03590 [Firmicutes bacterium]|nr:hypothetical protein [Bacillota bacterium]
MNAETFGVLLFVFIVFGLFYVLSAKAERWVKESYAERRRAEEVKATRGAKR